MFNKHHLLAAAISFGASVTNGAKIHENCLNKSSLAGVTGDGVPTFDQTDFILENYLTEQYPTYRRECRDPDSRKFNSFRLQMNTPGGNNFVLSPSIGPEELGTCRSFDIKQEIPIIKGTIFYDDVQVTGVFFEFENGDL